MEILKDELWKYKLPFDNSIYKEVKRYSFNLEKNEKEELNFEIDFFRTFFSIGQILDTISKIKQPDRLVKFKYAVEKRINCLLFCPKELVPYYKNIIKTKHKQNEAYLLNLLEHASTNGFIVSPSDLYKNIMGKKIFKIVKKQCLKYSKRKTDYITKHKIKAGQAKYYINDILEKIKKDFTSQFLWGKYKIDKFNIIDNSSMKYSTWKEKKVNYVDNALFLNNNMFMATENEVEYITNLNIYPGFAHFYKSVLPIDRMKNFDNGSSFLINGWSMFAVWHYQPTSYNKNNKYNLCKTASILLNKKYNQKNITNLYNQLLSYNKKTDSISQLITLTQYLGLFESYVLGALAVEYLVDLNNLGPKNFLEFLNKNNVGNFFEFYSNKILGNYKKLK